MSTDNNDPYPHKKPEKVVYICNLSEDVWPFIQAITSDKARAAEIEENANLADRDLFTSSDENELVFISPKQLNPQFVEYYSQLCNMKDLEILVPSKHTGVICDDICQDEKIINRLVEISNHVKKLTLTSYSATPQFFNLVRLLRSKGVTVYTPESPEEEDAWTVNFFGSKSGIRQLAQKSVAAEPDFLISDGLICVSILDAAKIAAKKYIKEDGVVIKTNKGHSGAGVLIFREGELSKIYEECQEQIYEVLAQDAYWDKFPIVIESLINVNPAVGGGFPNVEFKISKSGRIDYLYYCGLRVTNNGVFQGVEMNDDVMNDRLMTRIIDMGFFIGEQYAAAGYRGYYDVDLVAAKNNNLYVSESNTRRTGGSHVYKAALELIGDDFMSDSYTLSNNSWHISCKPNFEQLYAKLSEVLFDKKTKEGLVITSANLLSQGNLAYIVFAKNKKRALEIEQRAQQLVEELS
ncbi:MAG: hypothetical protein ACOZAN_00075 [Patescibacteria group bacterium]